MATVTGADVKRICDTTCKDTPEGREHSIECFRVRAEWLEQASKRIDRMRKDIRNMDRRIKRTLAKGR